MPMVADSNPSTPSVKVENSENHVIPDAIRFDPAKSLENKPKGKFPDLTSFFFFFKRNVMIKFSKTTCVQFAFPTWKSNISPPPWQKFFRFVEESLIHLIRILLHRHRVWARPKRYLDSKIKCHKAIPTSWTSIGIFFVAPTSYQSYKKGSLYRFEQAI